MAERGMAHYVRLVWLGWLIAFAYVSSQCTSGFVEQRLAASIIIPYGLRFVKRGGREWAGGCVKVLVLPGVCERCMNMLNSPVYKGLFDILPLLSKMVRYYKLRGIVTIYC